jgi:hypothetical protein
VVNTNNIDGSVILRRGTHDDLLGTSGDVSLSLLLGEVNTSAVSDVLAAAGTPLNLSGILLLEDLNLLSVDFNATFDLFHRALESS